ncbi:GTP cyclohydrolase I FolE2, partial [Klebsiella pneumoniae]
SGWKAYPLTLSAELRQSFTVTLKVGIPYSSTCPASAALSRHVAGLQFSKDFGNRAWMDIRLNPEAKSLPVLELIDYAEVALGTAVQTVVKRSDEQAFAVANGQNLMFCEDAARRLNNVFRCASFCEAFDIRVEHQESLHPHNAVARIHWKGSKNVT